MPKQLPFGASVLSAAIDTMLNDPDRETRRLARDFVHTYVDAYRDPSVSRIPADPQMSHAIQDFFDSRVEGAN